MLLEAAILIRGWREKLVSRFPLFYSYLLTVLIQDVIRYIAFLSYYRQPVYANIYWSTQFVSLVMGSIVVFEIYRLALQEFPGTAKMARILLAGAFAGVFLRLVITLQTNSPSWIKSTYVKLERDLRAVQSIAIIILVALFLWYAIPLGRNLGGILLGYATFVAVSVAQLSIVYYYQTRAQHFWGIAQPVSYTAVVALWTMKLWASEGAPRKNRARHSERSYQELANATSRSLDEARARLGAAVRP